MTIGRAKTSPPIILERRLWNNVGRPDFDAAGSVDEERSGATWRGGGEPIRSMEGLRDETRRIERSPAPGDRAQ
jgi:hypothetical protein